MIACSSDGCLSPSSGTFQKAAAARSSAEGSCHTQSQEVCFAAAMDLGST